MAEQTARTGKEMFYELPLSNGRVAQLWMPRYLSAADAQRLVAFIDALVIDDEGEAVRRG